MRYAKFRLNELNCNCFFNTISCLRQLAVTKVFNQLCSRNERRPFLSTDVWQWPPLGPSELALSGGQGDTLGMATGELDTRIQEEESDSVDGAFVMKNPRSRAVLTFIPQVQITILQYTLQLQLLLIIHTCCRSFRFISE